MSNQSLGILFGAIGVISATVIGIVGLIIAVPSLWWPSLGLMALICAIIIASFWLQTAKDRQDVAAWVSTPLLYKNLIDWAMIPLWQWFGSPVAGQAMKRQTIRAAMTPQLLDRSLLFAVAYPMIALIGFWLAGRPGALGDVTVLTSSAGTWDRPIIGAFLGVLILGLIWRWRAAHSSILWIKSTAQIGLLAAFIIASSGLTISSASGLIESDAAGAVAVAVAGAFAVAVAGAGAVADAVTGAIAGAFTAAFAVPGAVAVAGAVAVPVAVAGAGAGAVAGAVAGAATLIIILTLLLRRQKPILAYGIFVSGLCLAIIITAALIFRSDKTISEDIRGIFVFLGVFPLLNGLFDFVSYAVTLGLLKRGQKLDAAGAFWLGLLDLAFALLFFFLLGLALCLTILGLNTLVEDKIFDLPALLAGVQNRPGDYGWLYIMLFSTLVPTLLHVTLALFSLQGLIGHWPWAKEKVCALIQSSHTSNKQSLGAAAVIGLMWVLPTWLVIGAFWLLFHYGWGMVARIGNTYLNLFIWLFG